ncbi:Cna B-type domain-containing protein [Bulleidia extructa]|uniref:Cna B-type domain-containing protein n=1 Tax=Bulleidia extructa TaxID=118748 RepID=UPI0023557037|nr:Cna B-type domain-containing protein [Bulleidia extructa]
MKIQKTLSKIFTFLMSLTMMVGLFSVPIYARETETDITDKVTIDSITSPNAEIHNSTNVNDFHSSVDFNASVDYKIDLTVNKGTPIQTGDIIEIPVKAERGELFESVGLSVLDSEDGSLLGEATITRDKIRIKFTKKNNTKTSAKLTISTTLRNVGTYYGGFPTQAEVDAAKAKHPTGIDKVKILDKNANINVKSNYWLTEGTKIYGNYAPPEIKDPNAFFLIRQDKAGGTSGTNTSTKWTIVWNFSYYKYTVTAPSNGQKKETTLNSPAGAAFLFGYDKAYGSYSATETSYLEDTFPADMYKKITFDSVELTGMYLYEDGKTPLLRERYSDGKSVGVEHLSRGNGVKFDDLFTKKTAAVGQTYEQFKASLKPGEYGIYESPNGDKRLVVSLGKLGSKDPNQMYTWGALCDKLGKETIINRFFPCYAINANHELKPINTSPEKINEIYEKIKNWPICKVLLYMTADLVKPVMRTGASVENTATMSGQTVTAKNYFVVGEISLHTYKDGIAILKTDVKTGQGIEKAEFKLQEKDGTGNWIDSDVQNITVVGHAGSKENHRFYTNEKGILNIRGLSNGKTYRLLETKAPEGYDQTNPATSKEFAISFTEQDKNAPSNNKDLTLTNRKAEYKVTYKIVKNPNGEEIPSGSSSAPVDSKKYTFKSTVDVKADLSFAGYEFIGWHTQSGQSPVVKDSDGSFTMPSKDVELVGYWKKATKDIKIQYISEDTNMGTVTRASETINDTTGVAQGSVASEKEGYQFVGWYKQSDPGKTILSTAKTFVPTKDGSDHKYHEETYVARFKAREKTSVSVEKKWVGPAKNEVEVELLADGKATNQKITLNQGTNWKGEFKDLYKYDKDDGHEIEYRVKEKKISGYETVISGTAKSGYTITNTIAGKVSIAVRKEWVGKEGSSATIRLIANGKEILSTTLDSAHNWRHTFAGLEKYKDGVEIKYEIKEDAIANYESEITGNVANGFVVKNTNTEKVSVRVEKKWNGPKQTSVKVNLMADGVVQKQIELNEGGSWKGEFKELAKYAPDGHEIEYTVKEETPMNYESKITGNQQSGYTITNTNIEKVSVSVEKKWIGKEGALAKVELLADGVVKERVTLSKATNDWKYRFTNLAKYASDGHEIEYTVREEKVEGYETAISGTAKSGYTITNRITGKVTIAVRKKWIGKEGNRVVVNLYANGKKVGSQALTKDKDWQYTFTNLEKYENGQEIEYTVKEEKVEGYTTKIEGDMKSGYTIINKENSKKAKTPRTSDDHQGMMYGGLLMSSIMSMLGIVIMKRREME